MTRKKSSQFARFRRLLAASLLPTMLLAGCANNDSGSSSATEPVDNTTTTVPTVALSLSEGDTVTGDSTITLTFSESVQGVSVDSATGACSGTVTLTNATDTTTCLPLELTGSEASYTVDPTDLSSGNYVFTVTTGISSSASSTALAAASTVSFTVENDTMKSVIDQLTTDLTASGDLTASEVEAIADAARTEASNEGENNDLLTVIPEALIGAVIKIRADLSGVEETNAIKATVKSLMSNASGAASLTNSRSARVAAVGDTQNFPALLQALGRAILTASTGYTFYFEVLSESVVSNLSETGATAAEITSNNYISVFADEAAAESQRKGYDKATATNLISSLSTGVIAGISGLSDLTAEQKNAQTSSVRTSMVAVASSNGLYTSNIETSISNAAGNAGLDDGSSSSTSTGTAPGASTSASNPAFTLQLLHFSDVTGNEQSAIDSVDEFSALVSAFRGDANYGANTLLVSSGGHLDPQSVRFTAADNSTVYSVVLDTDDGSADMALMNALGVDAVALSPSEFDGGITVLKNAIESGDNVTANFPHLSNITNVTTAFGTADMEGTNGVYNTQQKGTLANYSVVSVGGELIGLVGVTSPDIDNVSSTGTLTISPDNDTLPATASDIAVTVQNTVNTLRAAEINKIVLLSHLQDIALEKSLPAELYDVDIIVAGGSGTRMGDSNDTLFSGTHVTDGSFDESYPYQTKDKENNPVLVVNVDGDYKYLGRLVVGFDQSGVIQTSSLDSAVNGAYAAISTVVSSVGGTADSTVTSLQTAIKAVVDAAYDNTTANTVGHDNITLSGSTVQLRTQDTQLGNFIAKANRWYADNLTTGITIDAAFKEARGIGNGLAIGPITNADIQSVLPDNQSLAILQVTATELKSMLEHSVALSSSTATPPRFLQVSGLRFSHDLDNKSRTVLDNGTVSENGTRITKIELMYDNGTLRSSVFANGTYDNASTNYRIVTTAFLANGGDLYPLTALGNASRIDLDNGSYTSAGGSSFSGHGKEQDALAEYFKAYHANETAAVTEDSLDNYTRITAE